jgi:hypothetical protein
MADLHRRDIGDAMGITFLHLITSYDNWLDSGTSISHYIIVFFLVLLSNLARFLTGISLNPETN